MITVAKFGGTSVADHQRMVECFKIIESDPDSRIIVISATAKTTNQLLEISKNCQLINENIKNQLIDQFYDRHKDILIQLDVYNSESELFLKKLILDLKSTCKKIEANPKNEIVKWQDELLSYGELTSSRIFYLGLMKYLKMGPTQVHWINATKIIKTDTQFGKAAPQIRKIRELVNSNLMPLLSKSGLIVTQGFIGSTNETETTTLGREGSDYSAALLAEAVNADQIKIWTDVPGVFSCDPKLIKNSLVLKDLSFTKAHELCLAGAKVLHPDTLLPAIRSNIPVFVGETQNPQKGGTWIGQSKVDLEEKVIQKPFLGLGVKKRQLLFSVKSAQNLTKNELLSKVFHIFSDFEVDCDLVTTSEEELVIILDLSRFEHVENLSYVSEKVVKELSKIAPTKMEKQLALITLVDQGNFSSSKIFARIIDEVKVLNEFNVRLIIKSLGGHSISLLTLEKDIDLICTRLHTVFFEHLWQEV